MNRREFLLSSLSVAPAGCGPADSASFSFKLKTRQRRERWVGIPLASLLFPA